MFTKTHKTLGLALILKGIMTTMAAAGTVAYIHGDVAPNGTVPSGGAAPFHQMLLTDSGNRGLTRYAAMVRSQGHTIDQYYDQNTALNRTFLNQFDTVVFGLHQKIWSTAEKNALDGWIRDGGSILIYSDSASGGNFQQVGLNNNTGQQVTNNIISRYGMEVTVDIGGGTRGYRPLTSSNPIVQGNPTFEGEGVSPVAVDQNAGVTILYPFEDTFKTNGSPNVNIRTNGITINNPRYACLAFADVGQGRVMAQFDRQPMWNNGEGSSIQRKDNLEIQRRIINFLVGSGGGTVDPGTGGGSTESTPFGGTARSIPGLIQAEDFDNGEQGLGYNDFEPTNRGPLSYRNDTGSGVDFENKTGQANGVNIGWTVESEWLQYTIDNPTASNFDIEARVASNIANPGDLQVTLDGAVLGTIQIGNTGGWSTWAIPKLSNIFIPAGNNQKLRFTIVNGAGFNYDWFRVTAVSGGNTGGGGTTTSTAFGGTNRPLPGLIEAEDFDNGGQGVGYNDTTNNNIGPSNYRSGTAVDLENMTGQANGVNIGWITNGEWTQYTVDVAAGTYDIEARVASNAGSPGDIRVELDGQNLGTIQIGNTGGWSTWATPSLSNVNLTGGTDKKLRITVINGAGFNFDWIRFTATSTGGGNTGGNNGGGTNGGGSSTAGTPFGGSARNLASTIQAEDFNVGGEDVAYNDSDTGNNGSSTYRSGENVDIGDGPERFIGWIANGEFWRYSVDAASGTYDIEARVASNSGNPGDLKVELDGVNLGTFPVVNTGGWNTWSVLKLSNVSIVGGSNQTLQLTSVNGGSYNIDWVRFTPVTATTNAISTSSVNNVEPSSEASITPQSVNASLSDDAYLQNGNLITGNLLRIQSGATTRETYLKFVITGANETVSGSKLLLTVTGDTGSGTIQVYRGSSNNWTEGNLSSANAPARGALIGIKTGNFPIGSVQEIDLSGITGDEVVSLIVVLDTGGNDVAFSSKEGAATPQLQVNSQ